MVERIILLPAPDSAASARTHAVAVAPRVPQAVEAPPPPPGTMTLTAQGSEARSRRRLEGEGDDARRQAIAAAFDAACRRARLAGGSPGALASFATSAFLAQQIYQEAMPAGLHLEPWAEGIGAYRRAGAAPPIESGAPAVVSLAV